MPDVRDENVTSTAKRSLGVGKAEAQRIWDATRADVQKLDEFTALVCLSDLVSMHIGYAEGRWPGFAQELVPAIMETLDKDGEEEDSAELIDPEVDRG